MARSATTPRPRAPNHATQSGTRTAPHTVTESREVWCMAARYSEAVGTADHSRIANGPVTLPSTPSFPQPRSLRGRLDPGALACVDRVGLTPRWEEARAAVYSVTSPVFLALAL